MDRGVLDVEHIFDGEGKIPVACNLTALCVKVLGRKRQIVSTEELCAVIAEFLCHDCERAGIVRFARGRDGGGERAFVDDGSSMNRRIRFADDLAAVVKCGGRDVFFRAVLCLYVDSSAIDSASGVILEPCSMENCFFLRLNKTAIFYICRLDMEMPCREYSRSGLRETSVCRKGKRVACIHRLLIVDVSPDVCREVSSRMEIAEVLGRRLVGKVAFHCDGHIPAAGEITAKRQDVRFDGQVSATLDGAVFNGQGILRNEGNIPVTRDAAVLRVHVFGGYSDVFAAEELGVVVVEFLCRNSERAGIVCFARGSDGGGERAGIGDG